MRTVILHGNRYDNATCYDPLLREIRMDVSPADIALALQRNLYVAVAVSEETDLELLYSRTQNGGGHSSWSRADDPAYTVLGGGTVPGMQGRQLGYMSTSVGDVIVVDGVAHACDRFGFVRLDGVSVDLEGMPVVNGGRLPDQMPSPAP
jgi:hypothetical protein